MSGRGDGPLCETCGSPGPANAVCRECAFRLVDGALASGSQDLSVLSADFVDPCGPAPDGVQFRYEHYEVCRSAEGELWELGRGAMGITYKATDTHLGCPVALKIINTRRLGGTKARDRFLREARTAAHLRHANIASVFHLGLGEEDCFYAMEYIEGETLESRVARQGALTIEIALDIVAQSARALQWAHSHKFIHRDIKPTNIMLVEDRHHSDGGVLVKLIDFGLVKAVVDEGADDVMCDAYFAGTPHYASPEQLHDGIADERSDIYSLGRCLGFMLDGVQSGERSAAIDRNEVLLAPEASAPSLSPVAPEPVGALLASMVATDPTSRPQSADELIARVAKCCAAIKHDAKRTVVSRGKNGRRRGWWLTTLAGSFCLAAILVAAAKWLPVRPAAATQPMASSTASVSPQSRALFVQGKEYFRKRTYADNQLAIKSFSDAIALSPSNAEAHANLASAYYENVARFGASPDQVDLAVASAERAIAVDPNFADAFQVLGAIRNMQGQPWEALLHLHRALELNPKAPLAISDFSLLWVCVGRPDLALPWAEAATRIEPSKVQGWHAAAEASVELCMDEQAERFYQRCLELRPSWMSAHCGLIRLHLLQGDFALAHRSFAEANSVQPDAICSLTLEAQIALFSGRYAEAEASYRQLIGRKRDGFVRYYSAVSYLSALGFLRLQAGDTAEGNAFMLEAESLHQTSSEGSEDIYDLAAIRAVQNRQDEALALLDRAINAGWNDYRATRLDPRFGCLRQLPQFDLLLTDLSARVASMRVRAEKLCQEPLKLSDYPVNPTVRSDGR